jgi:hypothetical protein
MTRVTGFWVTLDRFVYNAQRLSPQGRLIDDAMPPQNPAGVPITREVKHPRSSFQEPSWLWQECNATPASQKASTLRLYFT